MALHGTLLQNLLEDVVLLGVLAKLVLELLLRRRVERTLLAVLRHQDLPPGYDVGHRNGRISLPLLQLLLAVDEDAELVA